MTWTAANLAVPPAPREGVHGHVQLPGSKSMTHRGLVLGALAGGTSRLVNASPAEDCRRTADALARLGAGVRFEGQGVAVSGWGARPGPASEPLHAGASGTTARFLLPLLALGDGEYRLVGSPRLSRRPMRPLVQALKAIGVSAAAEVQGRSLPLTVQASGVEGGPVQLDAALSSQFASALLLAAPRFRQGLDLTLAGGRTVSRPYLEMTCAMMARFGVAVQRDGDARFRVPAGGDYRACDMAVEGDATAASYFFAAAAVCGGTVSCGPLNEDSTIQGDTGFAGLLERMGCAVDREQDRIVVRGSRGALRPLELSMNGMPDLVPTLAVTALFARGTTRISGVAHLRGKESDRLEDLAAELRRLGGRVAVTGDGLVIEGDGGETLVPAAIDPHEDHRLAMSFAVAGLRLPGMALRNPDCVGKSHPSFFHDLFSLADRSG